MPTIAIDIRATGADTFVAEMNRAAASLSKSLPQASRVADASINNTNKLLETQAAIFGRVRSQAIGYFATFIGVQAIQQFTRAIVDANNTIRSFSNTMSAVTDSQGEAAQGMAFVRAESERLGLSLASSATQFAKLSAATRGTSLQGQETRNIFTAVSEAARVLNLSVEGTEGAFKALEQMVSKGKVQAEELRGQLGERLPGAFKLAAEALGVTTDELNKMMERGEVVAEDLLPRLAKRISEVYSAAAINASNSPAAEFNRLKNAVLDLNNTIAESGFVEGIAEGARILNSVLNFIVQSGAIDIIASGITNIGIAIAAAFAGRSISYVYEYGSAMGRAAKESIAATKYAAELAKEKERISGALRRAAESQLAAAKQEMAASIGTDKATASTKAYNVALRNATKARLDHVLAEKAATVAMAQSAAASSLSATAMTTLGNAAKSAYNFIGGLPTLLIAAGYAAYQMYDSMANGSSKGQEGLRDLVNIAESAERAINSAKIAADGFSQEQVDKILAFTESDDRIRQYKVEIESLSMTIKELAGRYDTLPVSILYAAKLMKTAQTDLENEVAQREETIRTLFRSADAMDALSESQGQSSTKLREMVDALVRSGVSFEEAIEILDRLGLANRFLAQSFQEVGDAVDSASGKMGSITQKWADEAEQIGKTRAELIRLNAARDIERVMADNSLSTTEKTAEIALIEMYSEQLARAAEADTRKTRTTAKLRDESEDYIKALQKQVATFGMSDKAIRRYELSLKKMTPEQRRAAESALDIIDANEELARSWADADSAFETLVSGNADLIEVIKQQEDILNGLSPAQIEYNKNLREIAEIEEKLKKGKDGLTKAMRQELELRIKLLKTANENAEAIDVETIAARELESILREFDDIGTENLQRQIKLVGEALSKATNPEEIARLQKAFDGLNGKARDYADTMLNDGISSLKSIATEGSKAYKILGIAQDALNVKSAIAAVLEQGKGDPYTAFARMAAMAAAVATLVGSLGSFRGFSGGAEQRQATQGTGTILGDDDAKSESIRRATEITADATSQLVGLNRGMLNALKAMQAGLSGASNLIARGGDIDMGGAPAPKLPAILGGGLLDSLLGGIASTLLGARSRVSDTGIMIGGGMLTDLLEGISVGAYQETQSRSWWFGSTRTNTDVVDLGADVTNQFQLVLNSLVDTVTAAAQILGLSMDQINAAIATFKIEEIRISTMDLSAEEAQAELEAVFSALFDGLAGHVVPFIDQFQRVGEGLGETLVRVATSVQVVQEAFRQLGVAFNVVDPETVAQLSVNLVDLMGDIDGLISGLNTFMNAFATDAHLFTMAQSSLSAAFAEVGLTLPTSREGMWELMQSIDATTEAGQRQIATILRLAGVADSYYDSLEAQAARLQELNDLMDAYDWDIYLSGLSDYQKEVAKLNKYYDELIQTFIAAGASAEQLARIEAQRADALERLQQIEDERIEAIERERGLRQQGLLDDIANDLENLGLNSWQLTLKNIRKEADDYIAALMETGMSLENATSRVQAWTEAMIEAARVAAQAEYDALAQSVSDDLAVALGITDFRKTMIDIQRNYNATVKSLNEAAIAAGHAGASERDLAKAMQLATIQRAKAIAQLEEEARALAGELYGTPLSKIADEIAALEAAESAAASVRDFGNAMEEAARRAAEAMDLLLGDKSPLRAADKLPIALDALRRGETDADTVLGIARQVYSSGAAYNRIFQEVQGIMASRPYDSDDSASSQQRVSAQMAALLEQQAQLQAEQAERQRFIQASNLASMLADLSNATGEGYAAVAGNLGFSLEQLAADLKLGTVEDVEAYLDALTAEQDVIQELFNTPTAGDLKIIEAIGALKDAVTNNPAVDSNSDIIESGESESDKTLQDVRSLLQELVDRLPIAAETTAQVLVDISDDVSRMLINSESDTLTEIVQSRRGI